MSGKQRPASARLAEQRRQQAERDRRRARVLRGTVVLVVLVVLTAVGVAVQLSRQSDDATAALPAGVHGAGDGVAFGPKDAPVTVDVYEDFQCPICRELEQRMGGTIASMANDGSVRVVFHPLSFLGPESERAANAAGCAAEAGRFLQLHRTLFEEQPPEHTGGFTTADLVALGQQAGIDEPGFEKCVRDGAYDGWVSEVDRTGRDSGVTGTPTIRVNGADLSRDAYSAAGLRRTVRAAAAE